MSPAIRTGITAGLLALIVVLLFGNLSGVVLGLLAGAGATVLLDGRVEWPSRNAAIVGGVTTGAVSGLLILVGQFIHDLFLMPLAGQPVATAPGSTLQAGLISVVLAALAGGVVGAIVTLPERQRQVGLLGLLVAFVLVYPFLDQQISLGWTPTLISVLIYVVLALGLNIVVGYAGLLDLGYAAFFAIGAYTTGLLLSPQVGINWDHPLSFWLVIWIAAGVAGLFGLILGAPTLPLRGDYLAIVTLGFGEIVPIVFRNLTRVEIKEPFTGMCLVGCEKAVNLTGGEAGINPISHPWLPFVGQFQTGRDLPWYFLILGIIALTIFLISRLRNSRLGRAWTAMREDELAAASMGIDIVGTKLLAFAMGATFSGFGGAFFASYISAIFPGVFDFSVSVIILCMVILGGLGNMTGVILGGLIIMMSDRLFLPQLATLIKNILNTSVLPNIADPAMKDFVATSVDPSQFRLLLFGLTLVIMMAVRPEGLIPNVRRRAELHEVDPAEAAVATEAKAPAK